MARSPRSLAPFSALGPGWGLALLLVLTGGCIELPEFDAPRIPANLGAALDEEPENCSPGTFECACRPDDSCDAGLECNAGACEVPGSTTGDGDGDPTSTGDGDGDPTSTGDGDGDPTSTGDGDGDPTSTGDGDGDPTSTGDGDGDPLPECVFDEDCPYAHLCELGFCELQANLAFVTSQAHPPTFGGLAGADMLCNEAAQSAGLEGNFVALLGDSQTYLTQRIDVLDVSGWVRTDLRNLANLAYQITSGELFYPLVYDEFGNDIGGVPVYTGGIESVDTCNDWTSADPEAFATAGYSAATGDGKIDDQLLQCDTALAHLYCYQIDHQLAWQGQPELPPSYRYAFLSSTFMGADSGLAYIDNACQTEAVFFGLADNDQVYKAWVADLGTTPNSRFDLGGPPWVRVDGAMIVAQANDLSDPSKYLTPINVSAEGWHFSGDVWTGSTGPEVPGDPDSTCDGWGVGEFPGSIGRASRLDEQFGASTASCGTVLPVYCLQE